MKVAYRAATAQCMDRWVERNGVPEKDEQMDGSWDDFHLLSLPEMVRVMPDSVLPIVFGSPTHTHAFARP